MNRRLRSPWTSACAILLIGALTSPTRAEVFFEDDFENPEYLDEFGLPSDENIQVEGGWLFVDENEPVEASTWTGTNPGGRLAPPDAEGFPTEGVFLISDSDAQTASNPPGTGMSHDVWSPVIDIAGSEEVWVHFDCMAQLNNNGFAVFDVDVTIDDGETWTNVYRTVAPARPAEPLPTNDNADGFFGHLDLDLSEAAGGADEIRIRWRHFEPNFDWWIAIDNVVVDDVPGPQKASRQPAEGDAVILLPLETFSTGIPSSWTIRSDAEPANTGTETWHTTDKGGRYTPGEVSEQGVNRLTHPDPDPNFAIIDSDADPDPFEDEYLITPTLDCSCAEQVYLHVESETILNAGEVQEILLSIDGGESFEPVPIFSYSHGAGFDAGEEPFYADLVLSVPIAAGEPEVAFAFHYQSGGNQWWWAIDNVEVTGVDVDGDCPRVNCANRNFRTQGFDPATASVTMSWNTLEGDTAHQVLANGVPVGDPLPAETTTFTDTAPPAAETLTYSLQSFEGEVVRTDCSAEPLIPRRCPADLRCCYDIETGEVTLSWTNGVNVDGASWRIRRNGVPVTSAALDAASFVDTRVPGPGVYTYTLELNGGNAAQCPDLPLSCSVTVTGGEILFFDDFECYSKESDDDVLAAGWRIVDENDPIETSTWTIRNIADRRNPPTEDGSPSTGNFLISDSDAQAGSNTPGSGMSHDVWSPPIDCSAADDVWLHFDCGAQLNNNGEAVFDVDVSTDDGETWTNAFRRIAPARSAAPFPTVDTVDGFFGRLHLDISELAAGEPEVTIRWRHFEPSFDWWIAIDNVQVDTVPRAGGNVELLETADFSDGIPFEWEIETPDPFGQWVGQDGCFLLGGGDTSLHHFENGEFASVCGQAIDEYLITPIIDCSEVTNVYLHVKSAIHMGAPTAEILVSLNGGDDYEEAPVFRYDQRSLFDPLEEPFYGEYIFEVPDAAGQEEVVFAFHFQVTGAPEGWWAIDDVQVTGDGEDVGTPFVRGDSDASGGINLNDGIVTLNFLFLGTAPPACLDAADSDDSGVLLLNDAIQVFNWLFTGGPPPAEPTPTTGNYPASDCDTDPTEDGLDCATVPGPCAG